MLLELGACGLALYGVHRWKHWEEYKVKNKWKTLMRVEEKVGKNIKVKPTFEIMKVLEKEYGFDLIVSIPVDKCYDDLVKMRAKIENVMGCEIQMQQSKGINSAYVRLLYDVSKCDDLKFKLKWEKVMIKAGVKNHSDETFKIDKIIPQDKYGKDLVIDLVDGLPYKKLEETIPVIESNFNCVTELEWKRFKGQAYLKMADIEFNEKLPFTPVETKSSELYFGQTYFRENLIANMQDYTNVLVVGANGSGKSRDVFIMQTNQIYWHDDIDLYEIQVSDKKDLQKFSKVKQCKYFAYNIDKTDQLFKYLLLIQKERNKEINKYGFNNISEYNKRFPNKKFNNIFVYIDEMAALMPPEMKEIDKNDYEIKKRIIHNFIKLIRESRSAGMYFVVCLQRPDRISLDPNIKALLNIIVGFRSNNKATALTMTGDYSTYQLDNRTAIFMGSTDKVMKTLYIDDKIIKKYIGSKIEENHQYVDIYEPFKKTDNNVIILPQGDKEVAATTNTKSKGDIRLDGLSNGK